jgi:Cu(I)/Ag(I) efflux system membrane protein CusA/SilA
MHGAVERVRPKMMTVTAIMAGLVPILWSAGTGPRSCADRGPHGGRHGLVDRADPAGYSGALCSVKGWRLSRG